MALPLTAGAALIDPHDGLADLRAGCLRATAPTVFRADPLRVLRLARLVGEMEGAVAEVGTLALARAASAGLTGVAAERIREELERLLASPHAAAGLATLEAAGGGWALIGTAGSAAAAAAAVGELDQALTFLAAAGFRLTGEELRLARLARLALAAAPRDANRPWSSWPPRAGSPGTTRARRHGWSAHRPPGRKTGINGASSIPPERAGGRRSPSSWPTAS